VSKVPKHTELISYLAILGDGLGVPGTRYQVQAILPPKKPKKFKKARKIRRS